MYFLSFRLGLRHNILCRSMACYIQVLGTGSSEVGPCVSLVCDSGRYLFNCPEHLQAVLIENSMKPKSLKHIFVTRSSWENIGGLPGLALQTKDFKGGCPSITVPYDLIKLAEISKEFMAGEKAVMNVTAATNEIGQARVFTSNDFTVTAVELMPANTQQRYASTISDRDSEGLAIKRVRLCKDKTRSVVAYVVKMANIRGKFDTKKAIELGLKSGPDFRELSDGFAVTNSAGETIYPHQVIGPDQIGSQLLVLECPCLSFLSPLTAHPCLQSSKLNPLLVIHITPKEVFETTVYQRWMESFKDTQHMILHSDFCPPEMTIKSCFDFQLSLHLVDSNTFHVPRFASDGKHTECTVDAAVITGQNSLKFHVRPISRLGLIERSPVEPWDTFASNSMKRLSVNSKFVEQLKNHPTADASIMERQLVTGSRTTLISPPNTLITFLGTGASCPSRYRNLSAILLHLPNGEFMLLDAGEGALGQLYKCFGPSIADKIVMNLRCVFISHIHGDHHLGLIRILHKRDLLMEGCSDSNIPLILGPPTLQNWLRNYSSFCEDINFQFCVSSHDTILQHIGFTKVQIVPVIHTVPSCGIVLHHKDGWKVVYSGDTRPCNELIKAGVGTSLLIHEATHKHCLLENAIINQHTTDVEAVKVAVDMKAEFAVFTHFSQRYAKDISTLFSDLLPNMAVAFDFMTVDLANLQQLQKLTPTLPNILSTLFLKENDV